MTSQYLLYLVMFVVQNKNLFSTNIENHNIDTRQRNDLYLPQANLTTHQKGAYYLGIKIFNNFPMEIKNVADCIKKFQIALIQFLYTYSYHTLEEYFNQSWITYYITKIAYNIGISFEVLSYGTLYKYSLTVHYDLISFPCINLMSYLCTVFIKLLFEFYCHGSFFTIAILMTCSITTLLHLWNTE